MAVAHRRVRPHIATLCLRSLRWPRQCHVIHLQDIALVARSSSLLIERTHLLHSVKRNDRGGVLVPLGASVGSFCTSIRAEYLSIRKLLSNSQFLKVGRAVAAVLRCQRRRGGKTKGSGSGVIKKIAKQRRLSAWQIFQQGNPNPGSSIQQSSRAGYMATLSQRYENLSLEAKQALQQRADEASGQREQVSATPLSQPIAQHNLPRKQLGRLTKRRVTPLRGTRSGLVDTGLGTTTLHLDLSMPPSSMRKRARSVSKNPLRSYCKQLGILAQSTCVSHQAWRHLQKQPSPRRSLRFCGQPR